VSLRKPVSNSCAHAEKREVQAKAGSSRLAEDHEGTRLKSASTSRNPCKCGSLVLLEAKRSPRISEIARFSAARGVSTARSPRAGAPSDRLVLPLVGADVRPEALGAAGAVEVVREAAGRRLPEDRLGVVASWSRSAA
jgi:hypothetical protein